MNNAVDLLKSACKGGATEKAGLENATMPNAESQDALSYLQAAYVSIFKTALPAFQMQKKRKVLQTAYALIPQYTLPFLNFVRQLAPALPVTFISKSRLNKGTTSGADSMGHGPSTITNGWARGSTMSKRKTNKKLTKLY